jgi:DNA transformation protein
MPAPLPDYVTHSVELLSPLGAVRVLRMFGGFGLYIDDVFMALVANEQLYLKADDTTRARFEAAGCRPFVYEGGSKTVTMSYWTAPDDALESPALMLPWARLAFEAGLRARNAKTRTKRPSTKRKPRS